MKFKVYLLAFIMLMSMGLFPGLNTATAQDGFKLEVTPGCGYNYLEWDAVPGAAHYWIYRGPGIGQEYSTPLTDFPVKETHFKDTINIVNDQLYCYYVRAVDAGANEFAQSIEDCATPTCPEEEDDCVRILKYQIDNKMYWVDDAQKGPMEASPLINQNRMFLLIKYVAEEVGATVDWVGSERKVIVTTTDHNVIEIWLNNPTAQINGQPVQIDPNNPAVVGYVVNDRTVLPMRFVAENLGAGGPNDIKWFAETKTVALYFDDPECRECKCMTISSVNATSDPPSAVAVDGAGKNWNLTFEGNAGVLAGRLQVGMCYEICGYVQGGAGGGDSDIGTPSPGLVTPTHIANVFRTTSIRSVECPCEPEGDDDGGGACSICVHINRVAGDRAWVTDEWGVNWVLIRSPKLQAQFMEGSCITVTGNIVQGTNGAPGFEVERIGEGTCCDDPPTQECVCVTITRKVDINDNFSVIVAGEGEENIQWSLLVPRNLARDMREGSCWKVCGLVEEQDDSVGTPMPGKAMKVETAVKEDCCVAPKQECICVVVMRKIDINDNTTIVVGREEKDGTEWNLAVPRNLAGPMKEGECWKVCGTNQGQDDSASTRDMPRKAMKVETVVKEDCCGEPEPDPDCICITIDTVQCYYDPPTVEATDAQGNKWNLYLSDDICSKMMVGQCWTVCGTEREHDGVSTPLPYKEMDVTRAKQGGKCCNAESKCDDQTISGRVVSRASGDTYDDWIYVKECSNPNSTNNTLVRATMGLWDTTHTMQIKDLKEGICATFCVTTWDDGQYHATSWTVDSMSGNCCGSEKSKSADCKWTTVQVLSAEREGSDGYPWVVSLKVCGGEFAVIDSFVASENQRVDKSGKYKIFDYFGCAKVCLDGKAISEWIALPLVKDCCGGAEEPKPAGKRCEGKKIFGTVSVRNPGGEGYSDMLFVTECLNPVSEMGVMLTADPDLKDTTGKMSIKDIKKGVCGIFCVSMHGSSNVLSVDSWTLVSTNGDCCTPMTPPEIVVGKIGSIRDNGDDLTVFVSTCPDLNENVQLGYVVKKDLKDTAGRYIFQKYGAGKCVVMKVKGDRIISWTALDQDEKCCSAIYEGQITNTSKQDNGDVFVTIKQCDDFNTQFFIDPNMRDVHGQFTFAEYTSKYKHCVRFFTNRNRVVAWQSMKNSQCCVDNYDWSKIIFNGFTNDDNIDGEGAILTLEYEACDEYRMRDKYLMVQPGLRDESGLYSFKTLPPGSCIQVTYTKNNSGIYIVSWVYKGWGDCCPK